MIPLGLYGAAQPVASAGLSIEYVTATGVTTAGTSPTATLTGVSLGAAAADRTIVVAVTSYQGSAGTIASVTVAGQPVTLDVNPSVLASIAIGRVSVPTGTTGTIVITRSGVGVNFSVAVYRVTGGTLTPASAAGSSSNAATVTLPTDGVGFAACSAVSPANPTWTNLTVDFYDLRSGVGLSGGDFAGTGSYTVNSGATANNWRSIAAVAYSVT